MRKNYFALALLPLFITISFSLKSQTTNNFWTKSTISNKSEIQKLNYGIPPKEYSSYDLDLEAFNNVLMTAPKINQINKSQGKLLFIPIDNGEFELFEVFESSLLDESFQRKHSEIGTYSGRSVNKKGYSIHFSITIFGMHGMIYNNIGETSFIDPQTKDYKTYMLYNKKDAEATLMQCLNGQFTESKKNTGVKLKQDPGTESTKRQYTVAIATTAEFSQHYISLANAENEDDNYKKLMVQNGVIAIMERVNTIYKNELAIEFTLLDNSDIIFLNSDPFPDTDVVTQSFLDKSQEVIDDKIGNENYNIGHTFGISTENRGKARLGSVCKESVKSMGASLYNGFSELGFSIGLVAHELGHQFGANHTFSSTDGQCEDNINLSTAVEPLGGGTIMSYAGAWCNGINSSVQDYFHFISREEIWTNISDGIDDCGRIISINNNPPVVAELQNFNIPISTPFVLDVNATDDDELLYTWEQIDAGTTTYPLESSNTTGPLFESRNPYASSERHFPNEYVYIYENQPNEFEVLPSVAREINFGVSVRDNNLEGAQITSKKLRITVDGGSGPFEISSPTSQSNWQVGDNVEVIWDVADTNNHPINCTAVNILLSLDNARSFPYTIASNIPNNGNYSFVVPSYITSDARIKVQSVENIFYTISPRFNSNNSLTNIPDKNFEKALIDLNIDNDGIVNGSVATSDIFGVKFLDISGKNISDLTGIEGFINLEVLRYYQNQLTNLDVSQNTALVELNGGSNQLTSLDISQNKALEVLLCWGNQLESLNLGKITNLKKIWCGNNKLTDLDVSKNKDLTLLYCDNNQLSSLNLTQNINLWLLHCGTNPLSNLDLTQNTALEDLTCNDNQLTKLNINNNIALSRLICYTNQLTILDVSRNTKLEILSCYYNQLSDLDVTKNISLWSLNCEANQLSKIDISQNKSLSDFRCNINQLNNLDISQNANLESLVCDANKIKSLDVKQNTKLTTLHCSANLLTSIDVKQNTKLTSLSCGGNLFTSLDVKQNTKLTELFFSQSLLTSIDITQNTDLKILICDYNQLTSLDLSKHTALTHLYCNSAQLTSLNVRNGNNKILTAFRADGNPSLNCIEVDDTAWSTSNWTYIDSQTSFSEVCSQTTVITDSNFEQALIELEIITDSKVDGSVITSEISKIKNLDLSSRNINDLTGIEDFISLESLIIRNNQLASLNLGNNTNLIFLDASNNPITKLVLTNDDAAKSSDLKRNQKAIISPNNNFLELDISQSELVEINLTNIPNLKSLNVQGSKLTSLDVSSNSNLSTLNIIDNPILCVQVSQVQLNGIPTGWSKDSSTTYSENCQYALGVDDELLADGLKLYPNPVSNSVTIESQIPIQRVEIYTILGQKVLEISSDLGSVSTETLSKGIYMLKILSEKGSTTRRLIKQ